MQHQHRKNARIFRQHGQSQLTDSDADRTGNDQHTGTTLIIDATHNWAGQPLQQTTGEHQQTCLQGRCAQRVLQEERQYYNRTQQHTHARPNGYDCNAERPETKRLKVQ